LFGEFTSRELALTDRRDCHFGGRVLRSKITRFWVASAASPTLFRANASTKMHAFKPPPTDTDATLVVPPKSGRPPQPSRLFVSRHKTADNGHPHFEEEVYERDHAIAPGMPFGH
jgi:hypothetical protein